MLGAALLAEGIEVTGAVSSTESAERLISIGINPFIADLDGDLGSLPLEKEPEIFYMAPPPAGGILDSRMGRFIQALEKSGLTPRVVYLSTTGVYGDCDGAWVDESRELNPQTDRARCRVDAEGQLLQWSKRSGGEAVILRVSGIYGPDRLPVHFLKSGGPVLQDSVSPASNRIHSQDLVTVCRAAMALAANGEVYNVADGNPSSMADYMCRAADFLGMARPEEVDWETARLKMSQGMLSYLGENRRIDSTKMVEELKVSLEFPDLGSGLS